MEMVFYCLFLICLLISSYTAENAKFNLTENVLIYN